VVPEASAPPSVVAALSAQSAMLLAASKSGSPMPTAVPRPPGRSAVAQYPCGELQ